MKNSTVALVKEDTRYEGVKAVLDLLFKVEGFPNIKGRRLLVKPNLLSPTNQSASTHVDAVKAVLDSLITLSPREVIVADGSGLGDTDAAFSNFRYRSELSEYPIRLVDLNKDDFIETKLLSIEGEELVARLSKIALESDFRVSLTLPKTHDFAILTLSSKNMMGCLVGRDKIRMHGVVRWTGRDYEKSVQVIHKNIVTLMKHIPPHLSIIDGYTGMDCDGPDAGRVINLGTFIASYDFLAADAVCANVMGFNPLDIGYIYYSYHEGLGEADLKKIEVVGGRIEDVKLPFKPHSQYEIQKKWR